MTKEDTIKLYLQGCRVDCYAIIPLKAQGMTGMRMEGFELGQTVHPQLSGGSTYNRSVTLGIQGQRRTTGVQGANQSKGCYITML